MTIAMSAFEPHPMAASLVGVRRVGNLAPHRPGASSDGRARSRAIAAILFASIGASASAQTIDAGPETDPPGFELTEQRSYYEVRGDDLASLRDSMRRHPHESNDDPSSGLTTQHFDTYYELEPQPTGCRLKDVSVQVEVNIRLPRWTIKQGATKEARAYWQKMIAGLTLHEKGHRDNAVGAGRELQRRLNGLEGNDCKSLKREAERINERVMLRLRFREQLYDERTQHGIKQGSIL
jgi:predicted secreted Zn-dependent protease